MLLYTLVPIGCCDGHLLVRYVSGESSIIQCYVLLSGNIELRDIDNIHCSRELEQVRFTVNEITLKTKQRLQDRVTILAGHLFILIKLKSFYI